MRRRERVNCATGGERRETALRSEDFVYALVVLTPKLRGLRCVAERDRERRAVRVFQGKRKREKTLFFPLKITVYSLSYQTRLKVSIPNCARRWATTGPKLLFHDSKCQPFFRTLTDAMRVKGGTGGGAKSSVPPLPTPYMKWERVRPLFFHPRPTAAPARPIRSRFQEIRNLLPLSVRAHLPADLPASGFNPNRSDARRSPRIS